MKRMLFVLVLLAATVVAGYAHDASKGAMTVESNLTLEAGQTLSIKYRPLLVGSGETWSNLKSGGGGYKIGEVTTSAKLTCKEVVIPAGKHPVFFSSDGTDYFLHFGGTRREPGKLKVTLRSQDLAPNSKYLMWAVSHGNGFQDVHFVLAYGDMLGRVSFHVD